QAISIREGQGFKDHSARQAVDGGRDSDPERKRSDGDERKRRMLAQAAHCESQVSSKNMKRHRAFRRWLLHRERRSAAQRAPRFETSLRSRMKTRSILVTSTTDTI